MGRRRSLGPPTTALSPHGAAGWGLETGAKASLLLSWLRGSPRAPPALGSPTLATAADWLAEGGAGAGWGPDRLGPLKLASRPLSPTPSQSFLSKSRDSGFLNLSNSSWSSFQSPCRLGHLLPQVHYSGPLGFRPVHLGALTHPVRPRGPSLRYTVPVGPQPRTYTLY